MIDLEKVELKNGYIRIKRIPIWKAKKSFMDIDELENIDSREKALEFVKANLKRLEAIVEFVESSREKIGRVMIEAGVKSATRKKTLTDEAFIDSMDIGDIGIDCSEFPDMTRFLIEITFDPDWFGGHRKYIGVEADGQIRSLKCPTHF